MSVILVVEDDKDICETIGLLLEEKGHEVVTAFHGKEALRLLHAGLQPSVIILDLMMPVMSGWEFRKLMLRDPVIASIPTIMISGDTRSPQRTESLHPIALLTKPFEVDELLELVESARSH